MISRIKMPLLIGLTFSGLAYLIVSTLGYSSESFMYLSYLYILLGAIIGIKYELKLANKTDSLPSLMKNLVVVIEGEEMKLKRILTGEKYKVKGEVEKLQ